MAVKNFLKSKVTITWFLAIAFTIFLFASLSHARAWTNWFRMRGILSDSIWISAVLVVGLISYDIFKNGWQFTIRRFLAIAIILSCYLIGMIYFVVQPEERLHFVLIGIVTYLYYRAYKVTWPKSNRAGVVAFISGATIGICEEWLQLYVPGRYFDWRDISMNVSAAFLAWAGIKFAIE